MNFEMAASLALRHEQGYINDPKDPGGETKFGISKRAYPGEDIPNLTFERAKELYYRDYWTLTGCETVPGLLRFHLFDFALNSGPAQAVKVLQKRVGVFPDGSIGPKTLAAIHSWPIRALVGHYSLDRLAFMTTLPNFPVHGAGWVNRMVSNLRLMLEETK